ncbi:MAG: hypothetical protein EA398_02190 [Deltaproteobacteria bacterium]|nr:MAG: hypothetical protein EA398_02190 [Deltaproteobacteria bacterium]
MSRIHRPTQIRPLRRLVSCTAVPAALAWLLMASACVDTDLDAPRTSQAPPVTGVPTCSDYCLLVTGEACSDTPQYTNFDVCERTCEQFAGWEAGSFDQGRGNTIGCRMNSIDLAVTNPSESALYCDQAGLTGGNVCGSWCDVYCELMERNCANVPNSYLPPGECSSACAGFRTDGTPGDQRGDSVQCRIYHLTLAGNLAGSAPQDQLHCPHGRAVPNAFCVDDEPDGHDH